MKNKIAVLGLVLVIVSSLGIASYAYFGSTLGNQASINEISDSKIRDQAAKDLSERKEKGFNEVDSGDIMTARKAKEAKELRSLSELQNNTIFQIAVPEFLPQNAKLIGGFPGGSTPEGPWDNIIISYETPMGELQISQTLMINGYITLPSEFIDENVKRQKAVTRINKIKQTGKIWSELTWTTGERTAFGVYGELPLSILKKIAESLPVGDLAESVE